MLRDVGIDAFHWDPYAVNGYAVGFEGDESSSYDIVTAFEVWEHLPNPREELTRMFAKNPALHVATTSIYQQQSEDWAYLNTLTGRHVFFYSANAVRDIAKEFGYEVRIFDNQLLVFHQPGRIEWRSRLLDLLVAGRTSRWVRAWFAMQRSESLAVQDYLRQVEILEKSLAS